MEDRKGAWGRTRHPDVHRHFVAHTTRGGVARADHATTNCVGADGHYDPGVRHRLIGGAQRPGHAGRAGPGNQEQVGVAGAGRKKDPKPVDVIDRAEKGGYFPFFGAVGPGIDVA